MNALAEAIKVRKALEAGSGVDAAQFTGGRALGKESLQGKRRRCKCGKPDCPKCKGRLGSGKRFAAVEKEAAASGASDPAAVAAAAGFRKYGKARMEEMAAKGRRRASKAQKSFGALVEQVQKAHVKAHTRRTKSGKVVRVKEHETTRGPAKLHYGDGSTVDVMEYLHGKEHTHRGIHGTIQYRQSKDRYGNTVHHLTHEPSEKGKRTEVYQKQKQELGDDWVTDLYSDPETFGNVAHAQGYRMKSTKQG